MEYMAPLAQFRLEKTSLTHFNQRIKSAATSTSLHLLSIRLLEAMVASRYPAVLLSLYLSPLLLGILLFFLGIGSNEPTEYAILDKNDASVR